MEASSATWSCGKSSVKDECLAKTKIEEEMIDDMDSRVGMPDQLAGHGIQSVTISESLFADTWKQNLGNSDYISKSQSYDVMINYYICTKIKIKIIKHWPAVQRPIPARLHTYGVGSPGGCCMSKKGLFCPVRPDFLLWYGVGNARVLNRKTIFCWLDRFTYKIHYRSPKPPDDQVRCWAAVPSRVRRRRTNSWVRLSSKTLPVWTLCRCWLGETWILTVWNQTVLCRYLSHLRSCWKDPRGFNPQQFLLKLSLSKWSYLLGLLLPNTWEPWNSKYDVHDYPWKPNGSEISTSE